MLRIERVKKKYFILNSLQEVFHTGIVTKRVESFFPEGTSSESTHYFVELNYEFLIGFLYCMKISRVIE